MKIVWTQHSLIKLKQYGLSKTKILGILRKPERIEEGVALGTSAMMRTNKLFSNQSFKKNLRLDLQIKTKFSWQQKNKTPGEVWLMFKDRGDQRKIISCWRYPGITKPGEQIPIPEDIKLYLKNLEI